MSKLISKYATWACVPLLLCFGAAALRAAEDDGAPVSGDVWEAAHQGVVTGVAISPDGKTVASTGGDQRLVFHDAKTKKTLKELKLGTPEQNRLLFAPDGTWLLSFANNGFGAAIIDVATAETLRELETNGSILSGLALASDGKLAATVQRNVLRVYSTADGKLNYEIAAHPNYLISGVAFSADGKLLATAGADKKINIYDVATQAQRHSLEHKSRLLGVVFAPDGKTLFSSDDSRQLWSWDLTSGKGKLLAEPGLPLDLMAISPDGEFLMFPKSKAFWGIQSKGWMARKFQGPTNSVGAGAFGPQRYAIAGDNDGNLCIWQLPAKPKVRAQP